MPYPYYGNPYYPAPMQDNLMQMRQQYQPQQQPTAQNSGVIWVQGEEGAKAYMVAAGNSVLLMDSEKHCLPSVTSQTRLLISWSSPLCQNVPPKAGKYCVLQTAPGK